MNKVRVGVIGLAVHGTGELACNCGCARPVTPPVGFEGALAWGLPQSATKTRRSQTRATRTTEGMDVLLRLWP